MTASALCRSADALSAEDLPQQLNELIAATQVNELMITTITHTAEDRWHSYDLVARLAGVAGVAGLVPWSAPAERTSQRPAAVSSARLVRVRVRWRR